MPSLEKLSLPLLLALFAFAFSTDSALSSVGCAAAEGPASCSSRQTDTYSAVTNPYLCKPSCSCLQSRHTGARREARCYASMHVWFLTCGQDHDVRTMCDESVLPWVAVLSKSDVDLFMVFPRPGPPLQAPSIPAQQCLCISTAKRAFHARMAKVPARHCENLQSKRMRII